MIEALETIIPLDIVQNVLKFHRHPTAEILLEHFEIHNQTMPSYRTYYETRGRKVPSESFAKHFFLRNASSLRQLIRSNAEVKNRFKSIYYEPKMIK